MYEILIIVLGLVLLEWQLRRLEAGASSPLAPKRSDAKLSQMSDYAARLYSEKKWLAAEKAYLSVLKLDHKNVPAYSHLGIIYSTQKNMTDAIECFQIASRLHPSGTTLHNLGLAYLDNKNYIKAIAAFEKSIMFEPTAQRYVGLSKAHQKLHNRPEAVAALKKAAELDSSSKITQLLEQAESEAKAGAS
jgi:tetratricopeptide (TPR) repeat protein